MRLLVLTHPSHVSLLEAPSSVGVLQGLVSRPHGDAVTVLGAPAKTL